jgi:aquaporin Z
MPSFSYPIAALKSSASFAEAVETHWKEYLMEVVEVGVLMISICLSGALLYGAESPLRALLSLSPAENSFLMGATVAITTFLIIRSPYGRRSGAHLNPALTLAYLWLGRIHRWDAVNYVAAQFMGGLAGVFLSYQVIGRCLAAGPVHYAVTLPGHFGDAIAFLAEFLLAGLLMGVVLFATNHRRLTRFSPLFVALITVSYYVLGPSISGFSVNPARSFSSALFAWIWQGIWIYFAAPCLGMLAAAAIYIRSMGPSRVYCAKVFHDLQSPCPFPCRFQELFTNTGSINVDYEPSSTR